MKQMKSSTNPMQKHFGFTIVEIMVAITLSMILIAGVIQVYLSSKESFRVQHELARIQENQRIAVDFLQRDISKAGFVPYNGAALAQPRITVVDGGANNSDSITVAYTSLTDCLGNPTGGVAVNRYFISPATALQPMPQLMCLGNGNPNAQAIVDGIENMQILLGDNVTIANDPLTGPSADRYVNPGAIAQGLNIVSVRVALLARSLNPIRTQATAQNFTLLDSNIAQNDRIRRQMITTTIPIRN